MNKKLACGIVLTIFPTTLFSMLLLDIAARYFSKWIWTGLPVEVAASIVAVVCLTVFVTGARMLDEEWKNHLEKIKEEGKVND